MAVWGIAFLVGECVGLVLVVARLKGVVLPPVFRKWLVRLLLAVALVDFAILGFLPTTSLGEASRVAFYCFAGWGFVTVLVEAAEWLINKMAR